ncbi:hypothetical protein [Methanobacterium paludis]|uniref:Uncharacterized protein n=1 Tax=Methanobacterium paludis (strain DSM 25820 / JCM 18151 / SWAN1) TaxID=868131 RepID=F6D3G0_METPW|nr:hypothetical protein [Methanobacterium paludis]AEG19136.1 hypothetical protein MSWAN_2128 [Methanobacterium paludis]
MTQKKEKKDIEEKEELIEKFVTMPSPKASKRRSLSKRAQKAKKKETSRVKLAAIAFLVVAFLVGTSLGVYFMKSPAETPSVSMFINASAFPVATNTTSVITNNTTKTNTTKTNTTKIATTNATNSGTGSNSGTTKTTTTTTNSTPQP